MVSVIVPVYNNTRYLKECIDSLLAQTYYDVELILVDDGSDDDCARLCDSFRDVATVYHKPNGGVSSARNLGLEKVRGEYVCFVDSDDVISPRYIDTLVEMCERNDVPLAACAFQPFSDTIPTPAKSDGHKEYLFTGEDRFRNVFRDEHSITGLLCNKVFKKELLREVRFDPSLVQNEDLVFVLKVLRGCSTVAYTDDALYYYRQHPGSAVANLNQFKFENALLSADMVLALFEEEKMPGDIVQIGKDFRANWDMLYARYLCRTKPAGWYRRFLECREGFLRDNQAPPKSALQKTEFRLIRSRAAFIFYQTLKALIYG